MTQRVCQVRPIRLDVAAESAALLDLLDDYARDPMGGGAGLSPVTRQTLIARLKETPGYQGALAWRGDEAVGLINCFAGFSTFAARPLLNIHDLAVKAAVRGQGVGQALLAWAEERAVALDCCKLTLEVLSGNTVALATYARAGFAAYQLDPAAGQARFLEKKL
jgi:GNAT superfamily N-acetyltransferase